MSFVRRLQNALVKDHVVFPVIALNSLVLILSGFPYFRMEMKSLLFWIDYWCTAYFVLEFLLKINLWGWKDYWGSGWNRFDCIVIMLSSPMLLAPVILPAADFGLILLLRMGRLLRLFRLARLVPDFDKIASGLVRAFKASVGIVLALVIYNSLLGVMAANLFHDVAPQHFDNPLMSMYSVFKVFTVEGWYEIPDIIAAQGDPLMGVVARIFFVFAVLSGGIIGLSIANAVFVDEMVMDNTQNMEKRIIGANEVILEKLRTLKKHVDEQYQVLIQQLEEKK